MHAELNRPVVEPFPHLPVHLAHFHVPLECAVVPAPDPDVPSIEAARLFVDLAHPDTHEQVREAEGLQLEEHVAPFQRRVGIVVGADDRGIGELVSAHQATCDRPAPLGQGHPGRLAR